MDYSSSISPLSKTKHQLISSLDNSKRRRKAGLFVAEGLKSVVDFLHHPNRYIPEFVVVTSEFIKTSEFESLRSSGFSVPSIHEVGLREMRDLSLLSTPSDILGVFRIPVTTEEDGATNLSSGLYLLIDGVQDPGNMGTIIRTAHWFGIKKIFASRNTVDIFNPKCIQSTMGSLGVIDIVYTDLVRLVKGNPGIPALGLLLEGDNIFEFPLPSSAFVCMGSEGHGLSKELRQSLSLGLTIPPADPTDHPESLNVAIATAITLSCFAGSGR